MITEMGVGKLHVIDGAPFLSQELGNHEDPAFSMLC